MAFQLSDTMNKDKAFLVKRSELEGRLDPNFFKPYSRQINKLYNTTSLREHALFIKHPPEYPRVYAENGFQLIRSQNVRPDGIDLSNSPTYLAKEVTEDRENIYPEIGDVLVVRSGVNAGDTACIEVELPNSIVGADTLLLRFDSNVLPKYIQYFFSLKIGKEIMNRYLTGATNKHISPYYLGRVKITSPPVDVQAQVVTKMNAAYVAKKIREAQAQQLLDSVDTYLLKELAIELPAEEENSIQQRMFIRKFSEVSGGRFDPAYFEMRFTHLLEIIQTSPFQFTPVGEVCSFLNSGKTPAREEYSEEKTPYPIIKVASYQGDLIDLGKTDFTVKKQPYSAKKGDIFVLSAAHQPDYVGRFVKQLDEEPEQPTSFVGELICLRADSTLVNPDYLFALFRSDIFQMLMNREKRGQTSHIYSEDIKHILIPFPSLGKQNEIAAHIQTIRDQAKQLRAEAAAGLEQAKHEVEAMILGETVSNQAI
jgi:restriction endonuclease S subunit